MGARNLDHIGKPPYRVPFPKCAVRGSLSYSQLGPPGGLAICGFTARIISLTAA